MAVCKDIGAYSPVSTNYVNSAGNYTIDQITKFETEFAKYIAAEVSSNVIQDAADKYGDQFYKTLNTFNTGYIRTPYIVGIMKDNPGYDYVRQRFETGGNLTAFEYVEFLNQQSYDPTVFLQNINNQPKKVLSEMNSFFQGDFALALLGGVCGLMPAVFGAIPAFFNIIGQVDGLVKDAISFLNKIKNIEDPLQALFEKIKVTALINSIKEKMVSMIDGVMKNVKSAIENFSLANILTNIDSFISDQVVNNFIKLKERAMAFFTAENMENIKNKVKGLFDYAVGLFNNPNVEEIQFLISRFCGFMTGLETQIKDVKKPLDKFKEDFDETYNIVKTNSNIVTERVIENNGNRKDPVTKSQVINNLQEKQKQAGDTSVPPTVTEVENALTFDQLAKGKAANSVAYIDINHRSIGLGTNKIPESMGRKYWEGCTPDARRKLTALLTELAPEYGVFNINNAYRTHEYNEMLRREAKRDGRKGAAKNSKHKDGIAFDIIWDSYPQGRQKFIDTAIKYGFHGIGTYKNFVHIDTRPKLKFPSDKYPDGITRW